MAFAGVAVCVAAPLVALTVWHELEIAADHRAQARALTRDLTRPGPACREISEAQHLRRRRPMRNVFAFNGVWFGRRFGHADCMMIGLYEAGAGDGYPACRFTAPAVLRVAFAGGPVHIFDVGVGTSATVTVRDHVARCALTAPFRRP
ncbi:hypothetical protein [Phenylobacterium sp.]|uniref:hypothetical protein n=1 Tax=Phenylobacterium sp. TaxID=1871053 RepID=UPI00271C6FB1|nr:hypothetical protein [Phenylobacterium sp.]MDO8800018.1 hypothetical protein [Phenylobacterium sp.]